MADTMTIDEYLNQMKILRYKYLRLYDKAREAENKATSTRSSLNTDGRIQHKGVNMTESRLIDAADAWGAMKAAYNEYNAYRDQLDEGMRTLLYWEGCLIYKVYIHNVIAEKEDDLDGAEEILFTNNRKMIVSRLNEAKSHLREILISKGMDIE